MNENNERHLSEMSQGRTLEEIADFWDSHSLADFWDQTEEVEFTVRTLRRRRVTLDSEIYQQVEIEAKQRGILPEMLINLWVAERLALAA